MKFCVGDLVRYKDDGQYPSLNNTIGKVVGVDQIFGPKYVVVQFQVTSRTTLDLGIHYKNLKRVQKARKEVEKMWYEQ